MNMESEINSLSYGIYVTSNGHSDILLHKRKNILWYLSMSH